MSHFGVQERVQEILARRPSLSRVFEEAGVGYDCSQTGTLAQVCRKHGVDPEAFVERLEAAAWKPPSELPFDPMSASLTDLADHIEQTHHAYLRAEIPRLSEMVKRVAMVHGGRDPRLHPMRRAFLAAVAGLSSHVAREERVLFTTIRYLDACEDSPSFYFGSLAGLIAQMEVEHDQATADLKAARELSDDYAPPEWACCTYRAMLDGFTALEVDLHRHLHKEDDVLFPRALEMEALKQG